MTTLQRGLALMTLGAVVALGLLYYYAPPSIRDQQQRPSGDCSVLR